MRRIPRRKKPLDYLLPFLILISVGVIAVLGFQLFMNYGKQGKADVFFYVAEGKAKVLPYGNTDWDNAFSGTKLLLGDSLKSSFGSKVVLSFFNETLIRMGADTAVTLTDVEKTSDRETIVLNLDNGQLWLNGQKSAGVREAIYEVRTKNLKVTATGTVFAVDSDVEQIVRVFEGDVKVDVMIQVEGNERVADSFTVGVGQQLYLDAAALRAFEENKSPSLLSAVDDDFKTTSWYKWNVKEDSAPTDFSVSANTSVDTELTDEDTETVEGDSSADESNPDEETDADANADEADTVNNTDEETDDENNPVSTPEITEPVDTITDVGKLVIKGTVGSNVTKVVVESEVNGKSDSYVLSQFKEGDSVWSYNVSETFGNIASGDNTYRVYAYDKDGNKSSAARIIITYEKDKVEVSGDLAAPKVLTYNGSESSTVSTDTVTISGSVGGAEKVVVNGYTLSRFTAGASTWSYVASESLGNLKSGENSYTVYAVDPDGNKSETVSFTVTYNKTGADTSADEEVIDSNATTDTTEETTETTPATTEPVVEETPAETEVPFGF